MRYRIIQRNNCYRIQRQTFFVWRTMGQVEWGDWQPYQFENLKETEEYLERIRSYDEMMATLKKAKWKVIKEY